VKALVKKYPSVGLWLEDVPIPEIADNEVLIKTVKTSLCGTDIHIYKWDEWAAKTIVTPLVTGHEFMGEIAKIGKNVKGYKIGDRVSGEGHITCGQCPFCRTGKRHLCPNTVGIGVKRHGCFAEYFNFPAENLFALPSFISDDVAAIFDPFGNAVHTVFSANVVGQDVLITGAGPIGIMAAAVARKMGARTVVVDDTSDYRLELALKMGATHTVNIKKHTVEEVMKIAGITYGFAAGFEMSGNPQALNTLINLSQPGAKIALLGILPSACQIDWDLVIFKMLEIKGIHGREIFKTWYQMVNLLEAGLDISQVITHHLPAESFQESFDLMIKGQCGKVILEWH